MNPPVKLCKRDLSAGRRVDECDLIGYRDGAIMQ